MSPECIYGIHAVEAYVRSGQAIERLHLLHGRQDHRVAALIRDLTARGVAICHENRRLLDRLAGTTKHQGVVARVGLQSYLSLDELLVRCGQGTEVPLFVILDEVEDPHNLGAVIRTAEAVGANGVIISQRRAVGITPAVVKASAGATSNVPVARVGNLSQAIEQL